MKCARCKQVGAEAFAVALFGWRTDICRSCSNLLDEKAAVDADWRRWKVAGYELQSAIRVHYGYVAMIWNKYMDLEIGLRDRAKRWMDGGEF